MSESKTKNIECGRCGAVGQPVVVQGGVVPVGCKCHGSHDEPPRTLSVKVVAESETTCVFGLTPVLAALSNPGMAAGLGVVE